MPPKTQGISLKRTGGILPDGVYKVRIEKYELKQGQKSDYVALQLRSPSSSGTIFHNLMLSDSSRFRMEEFLDAIDAPKEGNMQLSQLRGKQVYVKLGNESYKGRLKNVVTNFLTEEVAKQEIELQGTMEEASDRIMNGNGSSEDENEVDEDGFPILPGSIPDREEETDQFPV